MPICGICWPEEVTPQISALRPSTRIPGREFLAEGRASGREDLVEQRLGLVLVRLLGERQFADEDLPGLREHALLASGQTALAVAAPQIADDLGDLVHVAGRELLQIGLVSARPVGRLLGVRGAQDLEYPLKAFLPDNIPHTDQFRVVCWNPHRQVALIDLENEVRPVLALDRTDLDFLDPSSPMVGVDDGVADLESHLARTPSAAPILPRAATRNSHGC